MPTSPTLIITLLFGVLFIQFIWPNLIRNHKFISYVLIPVALFGLWFSLIVYQAYLIENVFSVLTTEYSRKMLISYPKDEITHGQKIVGSFTATNDYLGIVGFRFWTFYRLNSDYMIFRIKEAGTNDWYYQNKYLSDQFQPNQYFTFGFPTIKDSSGNNYIFEIESSAGIKSDAVGVSNIDPVFVTKFKYPRDLILASPNNILGFVTDKFLNLMSKAEFKASSYIYLLPFAIYFITLSSRYAVVADKTRFFLFRAIAKAFKTISHSKDQISLLLVSVGIVLDIVYISKGDITLILLLILVWQISKHFTRQDALFLLSSFTLLVFSATTYYFNVPLISERSIAWVWLFLVLFVIKSLKAYKSDIQK